MTTSAEIAEAANLSKAYLLALDRIEHSMRLDADEVTLICRSLIALSQPARDTAPGGEVRERLRGAIRAPGIPDISDYGVTCIMDSVLTAFPTLGGARDTAMPSKVDIASTLSDWLDQPARGEATDAILALLRTAAPSTGRDVQCSDCPPVGYPTDQTRCLLCPRRSTAAEKEG